MCEHCKPDKQALSKPGHPHEFIIDDGAIFYYDSMDGWEGEKIDYCPYCSQCLTPEEPLTAEELKQMDGEPVWVVDTIHDHGSGYYLVNLNYKFALDIPGAVWPVIIDKDGWFFKFCNLGDGIAVYRHKPIEKEEGS